MNTGDGSMVHGIVDVVGHDSGKTVLYVLGAIGGAIFGGWSLFLQAFFILLALEFFTMLARDTLKKQLNPERTGRKIVEYMMLLFVVAAFYQIGLMVQAPTFARQSALAILNVHLFIGIMHHLRDVDVAPQALVRLARTLTEEMRE